MVYRYTYCMFHIRSPKTNLLFSGYVSHQILVVAVSKQYDNVGKETLDSRIVLVVFLPMVVHGSIFHHLMLAMVMIYEILKRLLHIAGQSPLAEHVLIHSHFLMLEVGRQKFVKMAYHVLYPLYRLWIVAPKGRVFKI